MTARGRAPDVSPRRPRVRRRAALFAALGILLILAVNPVTLRIWWFRLPYVPPGASLRVWCWDVAVVIFTIVAIAASRARANRDRVEPTPRLGVRVAAGVLAVLVPLLLAEGILRIRPGDAFSESLRKELRWRERHTPATVLVSDPIHVFSRELGWELRPALRTDDTTSNSEGFRGSREYTEERPAGVRRVVCVGDSFMFGERLRDEQTVPARLEAELNGSGVEQWEVLNLAVEGYGTDQQWLRLAQKGFRHHPDFVVLGFFEEDLERNVLSFRDYAKPFFALQDGRLTLQGVPVPSPEELLARPPTFPSIHLVSFAGTLFKAFRLSFSIGDLADTDAGRVTLAILDAMHAGAAGHGATFVLMSIPRPILPRGSDTERLLAGWARRTNTPFVNLRAAYLTLPSDQRERLYRGHWTPFGAGVTARLLAERIRALASARRCGIGSWATVFGTLCHRDGVSDGVIGAGGP